MSSSNHKKIFNQSYSSGKDTRKEVVDTVTSVIAKSTLSLPLHEEELYLTIDEAITNAMEHGNGWDPEKQIEVTISASDDELLLTVKDEGKGFTPNFSPPPPDFKLQQRGRGIYIIRQFCEPRWNKNGNEITLHFNIV